MKRQPNCCIANSVNLHKKNEKKIIATLYYENVNFFNKINNFFNEKKKFKVLYCQFGKLSYDNY